MSPLKPRNPGEQGEQLFGGEIVMVALAQALLPLSVACTVSIDVPMVPPAVKTVEPPEDELTVPSVFESDQAKVSPAGHVPPLHVAEAVNAWVPPVARDADDGLTETEASGGTGVELMVMVAVASLVTPLSVAFV